MRLFRSSTLSSQFLALAAMTFPFLSISAQSSGEGRPEPTAETKIGVSFDYVASADQEVDGADAGELEMARYAFEVDYAFDPTDAGQFSLGVGYAGTDLDFDAAVPLPDEFQEYDISLGYRTRFNDTWSLTSSLSVGVATDTEVDASDAVEVSGLVLGMRRWGPHHSAAFGLRASSRSEFPVLPVASYSYTPNDTWRFTFGFPRSEVAYRLDDATLLDFGTSFTGGTYRVDLGSLPASPFWILPAGKTEDDLDYRQVDLTVRLHRDFTPGFRATVSLGYSVYRYFEYDDLGTEIEPDGAFVAGLSLQGRF
jgi:hypothetical protein